MADEKGANWNGIEKVFGKDSLCRVVSSTFSNPKTPIETKFSMILIRKDLPV